MSRTLRSKAARNALFLAARGKCEICQKPLSADFHADHTVPWHMLKQTNVHEMQATCPACNLKKGGR